MGLSGIFKPEYLLKPRNILARWRYRATSGLPGMMTVPLLGQPFHIRPHEVIGHQILHFGLFDLTVTECLLRLAAPGDRAIDVGANIGYMAAVLARAVGPTGQVTAFEPHPEIFADLDANVTPRGVEAVQAAVSAEPGTATLHVPVEFGYNRGLATMEAVAGETEAVEVRTVTLDSWVGADGRIDVLKIDVEGHELGVLEGARRLLEDRRITHIVFEEHHAAGSAVIAHLQDAGYTVWHIAKTFFGPSIVEQGMAAPSSTWESPCFLATADPHQARHRLTPRGWRALRA
jgi:FkbM family methyltransferase